MLFPNLKLTPMLKQHLARAGERLPPSLLKAETQLLRKDIVHGITAAFAQATEDSTFTFKYAEIINLSPQPIGNHGWGDLLRSLSGPENGLIFKQPKGNACVLVTEDRPLATLSDGFWPFAVRLQTLPASTKRFSVDLTRRNVAEWDRACGYVPDAKVADLVHIIERGVAHVRAIVAADGGVMVIFRVVAHDFESWQYECSSLRDKCTCRDLKIARFSMHTLIPFSRGARGRGALLFLA